MVYMELMMSDHYLRDLKGATATTGDLVHIMSRDLQGSSYVSSTD